MSEESIWFELDLECQPLDSMKAINRFLLNPPAWRSLCEPLRPHSKQLIRNCDLVSHFADISLEKPESFCHFDADAPLAPRHDEELLPKTLVCHDMANGYHDDCAIDGTANHTAYTFYNWAGVDVFCYFSHHLVTVPPLGWINVAHAHGVKVIGTLITEWAEGAAFWSDMLDSESEIHNVASALVTIAKTLKFEGWLLNVENKISRPDKLLEFVKLLHKMLHEEIPNAELIWYDSVTEDGQLNWQNKLCDSNRIFFDACDGIFTNYSWNEQDIKESAALAAAAGRLTDVYVGIDVWGRNFYGGGMFNTQEAVRLVHSHGLSLAIFAPAWTHEAMDDEEHGTETRSLAGEPLTDLARFALRDRALWGSLWPYLNTRVPSQLPFKTSFCRGLGKKRRMYGEVLCNTPWYNLRHMQYQPNSNHGPHGYLLSTREKIRKVSQQAVRDGRGNLKYRQSLYEFTNQMYEESRKIIEKQEEQAADEEARREPHAMQHSLMDVPQEHRDNKFKNVLKRIFKFKKTKVNKQVPNGANEEDAMSPRDSQTVLHGNELGPGGATQEIEPRSHHTEESLHAHVDAKDSGVHHETDPASHRSETGHESQAGPSDSDRAVSSGRSLVSMPVRMQLGKTRDKLLAVAAVPDERECLEVCLDDSFNGGSCLRINPSDEIMREQRTIRLFHCDFAVEGVLVACVVTKRAARGPGQCLRLELAARDAAGAEHRVQLVARAGQPAQPAQEDSGCSATYYPIPHSDPAFHELQSYLVVNEPGFYVPVENAYGWNVFYFQVSLAGQRVRSAALLVGGAGSTGGVGGTGGTGGTGGALLLGHVALCARAAPRPPRRASTYSRGTLTIIP